MNRTTAVKSHSFDEETLWRAVIERNPSFDGNFFFAVRSTGIYCRPSCPARRPRRAQIAFFQTPDAAEQAGFRACRRCQPRNPSATDTQVELVRRLCRYIESRLDQPPTLEELRAEAGMSAFHLQRVFKRITGITPRQYAQTQRLSRFKTKVKKGASVTESMYNSGYGSSSRLYERASAELGMTPTTYQRNGKGMRIDYTIANCHLGKLLVAATPKGICSVRLGNRDASLEQEVLHEFPAAEVRRDDEALRESVEQILAHLDGRRPHLDLPLDVQATAFQRIVWQKLQEIPYGSTRSYSDVASAIGRPSATRAVARAIATNPVAVVIPCHRVIREDQSLGGYRWGVERKQKLLDRERSASKIS